MRWLAPLAVGQCQRAGLRGHPPSSLRYRCIGTCSTSGTRRSQRTRATGNPPRARPVSWPGALALLAIVAAAFVLAGCHPGEEGSAEDDALRGRVADLTKAFNAHDTGKINSF